MRYYKNGYIDYANESKKIAGLLAILPTNEGSNTIGDLELLSGLPPNSKKDNISISASLEKSKAKKPVKLYGNVKPQKIGLNSKIYEIDEQKSIDLKKFDTIILNLQLALKKLENECLKTVKANELNKEFEKEKKRLVKEAEEKLAKLEQDFNSKLESNNIKISSDDVTKTAAKNRAATVKNLEMITNSNITPEQALDFFANMNMDLNGSKKESKKISDTVDKRKQILKVTMPKTTMKYHDKNVLPIQMINSDEGFNLDNDSTEVNIRKNDSDALDLNTEKQINENIDLSSYIKNVKNKFLANAAAITEELDCDHVSINLNQWPTTWREFIEFQHENENLEALRQYVIKNFDVLYEKYMNETSELIHSICDVAALNNPDSFYYTLRHKNIKPIYKDDFKKNKNRLIGQAINQIYAE